MTETHADWLAREPFTLVLSAGFFGFFAHTGVLLALEQAGLRPRRVVGTSAGAIAGGCWASGVAAEVIAEQLASLQRADFWDPSWRELLPRRGLAPDPGTSLGLLRGRKFDALLARVLSDSEIAIEDCPIPFAAVTHDLLARRPVVHERGALRPAIRASAALPGMFGPVRLQGRLHADGGIRDRPGFSALVPGERTLYHHLLRRRGATGRLRSALNPRRAAAREAEELRAHDHRAVLVIPELPEVDPFALDQGHRAVALARDATLRWLATITLAERSSSSRRP